MNVIWDLAASDLRPGDVIVSDKERVEVTAVEARDHPTDPNGEPWVRWYGRIVKGWGRSNKIHAWSQPADRIFPTVERP